MCSSYRYSKYLLIFLSFFSASVFAQDAATPAVADKKPEAAQAPATEAKQADAKPAANKSPEKKMVQDGTITLQTTITGNQEQPRVLYILPWQSPVAANVDFESLDNEQKAVFGHVEREELRRELEASDGAP